MKIDKILKKIESTPQFRLEKIMGNDYQDTPGFCHTQHNLADYSNDVKKCILQNMGKTEYQKLLNWIKNNPKKIKLLFKNPNLKK